MFLLLKALKQQIEKGPVDAVTHDARYSLSEERLLREQINYNIVVLHVLHEEMDADDKVIVRANDCDTISQVKQKILDVLFKSVPFSERPNIYSVDIGKPRVVFITKESTRSKYSNIRNDSTTCGSKKKASLPVDAT